MIDTSPAALRKLADLLDYEYNTENTVKLLLAIAAEKEAQQPVAWMKTERVFKEYEGSSLEDKVGRLETRLLAYKPLHGDGWEPLYRAQHHPEQPLNMVAAADVPLPEPVRSTSLRPDSDCEPVFDIDQMRQYAEAYAKAKVAAALASQPKPTPVLLTDYEIDNVYMEGKWVWVGSLKITRAIESTVLRKNGFQLP